MEELIEYLMRLMELNTTSDTGNEAACAAYLEREFRRYGVETKVWTKGENRSSLAAWIPGKQKKTLVFHGHLDTAPYGEGVGWKFPPDRPSRIHHCICGRGALDCKSQVAVWMKLMIEQKQSGLQPDCSLLFLATADEENGGENGLSYVLEQSDCLDHSFLVLGEGGGFPFPFQDQWFYTFQTGERTDDWTTAPEEENPMRILEEGIRKGYYSEEIKAYFSYDFPVSGRRLDLEPLYRGMGKNFRQMPDSDVFCHYQSVFQRALSSFVPEAKLMPVITPGFSDNRYFRGLGIPTIGFFPLDYKNHLGGIHGKNEYISEQSLLLAYRVLQRAVNELILTK